MKIVTLIARILMGLLFLFASITYLFGLIEPPPTAGAMQTFNEGLEAARYLMPTVKVIELLCGVAFVVGRFVPLAAVVISPIIVNIVLVHAFLAPEGLPIAIFLVVANGLVAYRHRKAMKPLLEPKG